MDTSQEAKKPTSDPFDISLRGHAKFILYGPEQIMGAGHILFLNCIVIEAAGQKDFFCLAR